MSPEIRDEIIPHELQNDMVEHPEVIKEDIPVLLYVILSYQNCMNYSTTLSVHCYKTL
jgi:hypothetical protein